MYKSIKLIAALLGALACSPQYAEDKIEKPDFVYAEGTDLKLKNRSFVFLGVNICALANDENVFVWNSSAAYGTDPDNYIKSVFAKLKSRGINAVRFCAFQNYTGGGADFSSIDRVV